MSKNIVELDVREDIKNKQEPFQKIMTAVESLKDDDIFVLHAPFEPKPLFNVLGGKGLEASPEQLSDDHWKITFTRK